MATSNMLELKQKYLNERREFRLEANRIRLYVKDLDGETEVYTQYETITPTTRMITRQDGRLYIISISFGIFALIGLALNFAGISVLMRWTPLWAIASIILFCFHLYKRRRYFLIDLSDHKSIFFLANKPSKDELDGFIKSIYVARKNYLREKYFVINPANDPDSEIEKLKFLLQQELISESEFQETKASLTNQKLKDTGEFPIKGLVN